MTNRRRSGRLRQYQAWFAYYDAKQAQLIKLVVAAILLAIAGLAYLL